MTLIRKKLSKSQKILLAIVAVGLIAAPIVHLTGVYDLSALGEFAMSMSMAGATSGWIAAALAVGCGLAGFGLCYILKDYLIGMEGNSTNLTVTNNTGSYTRISWLGSKATKMQDAIGIKHVGIIAQIADQIHSAREMHHVISAIKVISY